MAPLGHRISQNSEEDATGLDPEAVDIGSGLSYRRRDPRYRSLPRPVFHVLTTA